MIEGVPWAGLLCVQEGRGQQGEILELVLGQLDLCRIGDDLQRPLSAVVQDHDREQRR